MSKSSKQAARTFVAANVKVGGEARAVRFLSNGRNFKATSRGLPRLTLRLDAERGQTIVRIARPEGQQSLRVASTDLSKVFAMAVKNVWAS